MLRVLELFAWGFALALCYTYVDRAKRGRPSFSAHPNVRLWTWEEILNAN